MCKCDVCDDPSGPYCLFCSVRCFPVGSVAGRKVRIAANKETRTQLHAAATQKTKDASMAADMIESARQELASAAVRAVGPMIDAGSRRLVDALRRRIGGK